MTDDKFSGLRKAVRVGYQVSTDEIRALLEAYDALAKAAPQQAESTPAKQRCDEWVMVPREPTANQLVDGAYEVPDPISHRGELTARMVYRAMLDAAPQQAEPVSYAVFDPSGEVVYAALSETRCIEYRDNEYRYGHSAAKHWAVRPVFAHPPAAEVQRLREALKPFAAIDLTTNQAVDAMDVLRARRALEGK